MKTYIILQINDKEIKLTLTEMLELREQLNNLTGLGYRSGESGTFNSQTNPPQIDFNVPAWSNTTSPVILKDE